MDGFQEGTVLIKTRIWTIARSDNVFINARHKMHSNWEVQEFPPLLEQSEIDMKQMVIYHSNNNFHRQQFKCCLQLKSSIRKQFKFSE